MSPSILYHNTKQLRLKPWELFAFKANCSKTGNFIYHGCMNWIRPLLAGILLIGLPIGWRGLDWLLFTLPLPLIYAASATLLALIFVMGPIKLLNLNIPRSWPWGFMLVLATGLYAGGGLSSLSSEAPDQRHCGVATFTGALYNLRPLFSHAISDDLELRNQLCWLRKLNQEVPESFATIEAQNDYFKEMQDKLMQPREKFRAALPLVTVLMVNILARLQESPGAFHQLRRGKQFMDNLNFWTRHYTTEISAREYGWWDWPVSSWIRFEYGLIERHWQQLVDSIIYQD
jgi:hypothetical protein